MPFEEATKTLVIAMLGSAGIFSYIGFKFKDEHVPMRLLFISIAVLMIPLSLATSWRGLEEQAGTTPTSAQTAIINMADTTYAAMLWIFIFTLGYFIVVFIKWCLETIKRYKEKKAFEEKIITE